MSVLFLPAGGIELAVIFAIIILLFGAKKIPELARASGESIGQFKKGREKAEKEIKEIEEEMEEIEETEDK